MAKIELSPGAVVKVVAVVVLLSGTYAFGYARGWIETLGEESYRIWYSGISSSKQGFGLGLDVMWFREGQTFFAEYQAEVTGGSFVVDVYQTFGQMGKSPRFIERIEDSGSGEVTWVIPESGFYSIYFRGSVLTSKPTRGYDVDYTVRWGARWPQE